MSIHIRTHHPAYGRVFNTPRAMCTQRGQFLIEYTVVCAALAVALGIAMADDQSPLWMLLEGFKTAYAKIGYAISLPI